MFYLPKEDWSPRFERTFFTVYLDSRNVHTTPPPSHSIDNNQLFRGKGSFPAVYFNVKVRCAHQEHICPRRYSQFRQLYDAICAVPPEEQHATQNHHKQSTHKEEALRIPPKTCFFQSIDDDFLDVRQEELYNFLAALLSRPGYVKHPAVIAFLDLYCFMGDENINEIETTT